MERVACHHQQANSCIFRHGEDVKRKFVRYTLAEYDAASRTVDANHGNRARAAFDTRVVSSAHVVDVLACVMWENQRMYVCIPYIYEPFK